MKLHKKGSPLGVLLVVIMLVVVAVVASMYLKADVDLKSAMPVTEQIASGNEYVFKESTPKESWTYSLILETDSNKGSVIVQGFDTKINAAISKSKNTDGSYNIYFESYSGISNPKLFKKGDLLFIAVPKKNGDLTVIWSTMQPQVGDSGDSVFVKR